MKTLPKIGSRVRFKGNCAIGPCSGTVTKHWKKLIHPDDFDWESDDIPPVLGIAPPHEWSASVQVDELPNDWPYIGTNVFAPQVSELEPE